MARHRLIEDNLSLVRRIAGRVHETVRPHVEMDELVSLGTTGLIEAAGRYDAARGVPFPIFAHYRIRGAIYDGLRRLGRVPRRVYQQLVASRQAGVCPAEREIRRRASPGPRPQRPPPAKRPRAIPGAVPEPVYSLSLEAAIEAGKQFPHAGGEPPDAALARKRLCHRLGEAVRTLPARERHVIEKHYFEGKSLVEAGQELGLSRSWSCRLHARAVDMLRDRLRALELEHLDDV